MNIYNYILRYKIDVRDISQLDYIIDTQDDLTKCLEIAIESRSPEFAIPIIRSTKYDIAYVNNMIITIIDNSNVIDLLAFFSDSMIVVVRELLNNNVTIPNKTYTHDMSLFMMICNLRHDKMAMLLIEYDFAYPDHMDKDGNTPLICAVRNKLENVAIALIATGRSNIMKHNIMNMTALSMACICGMTNVINAMIDSCECTICKIDILGCRPSDHALKHKLYNLHSRLSDMGC